MQKFQAVIFDMDGVIFDSERLYIDLWKPIAKRDHIPDIEGTILACTGTNRQETWRIFSEKYGETFPMEEYQKEISAGFQNIVDSGKMPVKPGVREILDFLKKKNIPTAIASSTKKDIVKKELSIAGFLDYFSEIIGGDMVKKSKPEPDIFLKAMEKLGKRPEECVIIEDSYNGIRAAQRSGGYTVMVPDLRQPDQEIRERTDEVFPSLAEVREWLKGRC